MCIVIVAKETFPSEDLLRAAADINKDGIGIAWRGKTKVNWEKGITMERLLQIGKDTPAPWVIHFRIATVGDPIPELCHPFPVDMKVTHNLKVPTKGSAAAVMAHNGHWFKWSEYFNSVYHLIPGGKYSDTRMMAVIAGFSQDPEKFLDSCNEKIAYMTMDDIKILGKGWEKGDEKEGFIYSNDIKWKMKQKGKTTNFYGGYQYHDEDYTNYCEGLSDNDRLNEYWRKSGQVEESEEEIAEFDEKLAACLESWGIVDISELTEEERAQVYSEAAELDLDEILEGSCPELASAQTGSGSD